MEKDKQNSRNEGVCTKGLSEQQRREKLQREVTLCITQDSYYLKIANGVVSAAAMHIQNESSEEKHTLVNPNWDLVIQIFKIIYDKDHRLFDSLGQYLSHTSISRTFYDAVARKEEIKF